MEGDYEIDVNEILIDIKEAEVLSIFFPMFRKSLVVDLRSNDQAPPMIRIMQMVASPQERMRTIRRLRPGFPRRHSLSVIGWPRYVDSLETNGIWQNIIEQLVGAGHPNPEQVMAHALGELRRQEKAELARVVMGQNYHTIWTGRPAAD